MIRSPLAVLRIAIVCLPLALVAGCGSSETEALQGTVVNVNPFALGQATTLGTAGQNGQIYRFELKSTSGIPQINVKLLIDSQYIVYAGHPAVVCTMGTCTVPGETPLALPYEAYTNSNGTYEVTVVYGWPAGGISGDFTAVEGFSGTSYGNSLITFTCTDPDTTDANECPT